MKRRDFLRQSALGLAALKLGPIPPCAGRPQSGRTVRNWVWLGAPRNITRDAFRKRLDDLHSLGVGGICIQEGSLDIVLPAAAEAGFEVHCWAWILCHNARRTMETHPDWYMVNRNGESCLTKPPYVDYYRWLCPNKPAVRDFLKERLLRLAAYREVAAVHLDYIRYPDVILPVGIQPKYNLVQETELPRYDYCYCDDCRRLFKAAAGLDPAAMEAPEKNQAWRRFRLKSVVDLVNHLAQAVHQAGKKVSAAVFPTPDIARRLVRQDWPRWDLDAFFPMMYHRDYNEGVDWIGNATRLDREALSGRGALLFSGMIVNTMTAEEIPAAVKVAFDNGADGVSVFGGIPEDRRAAFREALQTHGRT